MQIRPLWRHWAQECLGLLLPPACLNCGQRLSCGNDVPPLCPNCIDGITPLPSARCRRCGQAYHDLSPADHHCQSCLTDPPGFQSVHAVGRYDDTLREMLQKFKYRGQVVFDHLLGDLLMPCLPEYNTDLILPVPLHDRRLRARGYNQAGLIAQRLANHTGIPLRSDLLKRTRNTAPQQGLVAEQRRQNLHNAFALNESVKGLKILLVDDVMTTGTTLRSCSQVLDRNGAAWVAAAVIGRA